MLSTIGNKCIPGSELFISQGLCLRRSSRDNDTQSLEYFMKNKTYGLGQAVIGAAEGNNLDLLKYIVNFNSYDNVHLRFATKYSIKMVTLICFYI